MTLRTDLERASDVLKAMADVGCDAKRRDALLEYARVALVAATKAPASSLPADPEPERGVTELSEEDAAGLERFVRNTYAPAQDGPTIAFLTGVASRIRAARAEADRLRGELEAEQARRSSIVFARDEALRKLGEAEAKLAAQKPLPARESVLLVANRLRDPMDKVFETPATQKRVRVEYGVRMKIERIGDVHVDVACQLEKWAATLQSAPAPEVQFTEEDVCIIRGMAGDYADFTTTHLVASDLADRIAKLVKEAP